MTGPAIGVQPPRRAAARMGLGVPLALAVSAGLALSLQVFVLGRLATNLGSAELAASVNNAVAGSALLAIAVATRAAARAVGRIRAGARVRLWQLLMGANGGLYVIIASTAVPKVGVALFTVAVVCGQTVGSLVVDRLAISPGGQRPLTVPRVVGAVMALVAVGISALGAHEDLHLGWLGLAVLIGTGVALQQAALGHLARATGEPLAAAWVNTTVGLVVILAAWLLLTGASAPHGASAPLVQWLVPGLCNAASLVVIAKVVGRLGVLRLMLALIAGQSVAALVLDAVAPTAGEVVSVRTVLSVLLTLAAVAVSGIGRAAREPAGAGAAPTGPSPPATRRA